MLTHSGKLPEIAKFLTESTGRTFEHRDVYRVIQKLQKQFQTPGEEKPGYQDLQQMPAHGQGLKPQEGSAPPTSITPGLLFPNYNSMRSSLDKWSRTNFSPLTKIRSQGGRHTFGCPHRKARRSQGGFGIRRQRKSGRVDYVDCPFLVDTKVNPDGSCVVTRALTEHSGHPVSEQQFQKYRR